MRIMDFIQKIAIIAVIMIFTVSCSNEVPTEASNDKAIKESIINEKEAWENYLNNIIRNRELELLYTQKYPEINLNEYLEQNKISIQGDSFEIDILKSTNVMSFLIDLDKDGIDELCLLQCEGSIRHYYVKVFKKKNEVYIDVSTTDGYMFPVKYNNEAHFIRIEKDFETKFTDSVIEYELKGLTFKEKRVFNIKYTYDVSELPKLMTKIIDDEYLNSLNTYKISDSNVAKIDEASSEYEPSYDIELIDKKNNNIFRFTTKLWFTSVGYAPNYWKIESKDDSTHKFKGIDQIVTYTDTNEAVCFGFRFYKDESNNIFLLKVSYPFFTKDAYKDGDLILQLFKFNKNSVEEIEKELIEPKVEVQIEKADCI